MLLSLALALLVAQGASPDTVPAPRPPIPERTFLDAGAEDILRRVREQRDSTRVAIQAYQALGRERVSVGMRALGRERIFFRSEHAARIHWRRYGTSRVEVLGSRQVLPMFTRGISVPDDVRSEGLGLAFDPSDDGFFGQFIGLSAPESDDNDWFLPPLRPGSEADYQFRSGDTTRIRLPDGSTVRLLELQVLPRRNDSRLVRGSYWLDAETHAPVRGVFRLARAFDLQVDRNLMDADSRESLDEVPHAVRPLIFPLRADLRFLTVEYGLWEGRWWLPRLAAVDAVAEVGTFGTFPVRFERAYSDYRVIGPEGNGALAAASGDSVITECPRPRERRSRADTTAAAGAPGAAAAADADEVAPADDGSPVRTTRSCRCERGRCGWWEVEAPRDRERLIASEYLPPSIYASGETLISGDELDELVGRLRALTPAAWAMPRPDFAWRVAQGDLLRYNRVEGLSLGARGTVTYGALAGDATVRLGVADLEPRGELGVAREGLMYRLRGAGYHRLAEVDPLQRPFSLGNSLSAVLLGRDEGDYFRGTGAEVTLSPARTRLQTWSLRLFAEQQRSAEKETDISIPHLLDRERRFRPNLEAERADQAGASLRTRVDRGLDPTGFRWGADLFLEGATGTFDYVRPAVGASLSTPLPGRFLGALEVGAGTSFGDLPRQSAWYLGGAGSMRGYAPRAAGGESFWRARAEVSNSLPGARWVLFSDAGWAGSRDDVRIDPLLLSAGAGASFLDGLIRFDLARTLRGERQWRAELYLNGSL
jgi:hypothetical protein